jgi:GH25 family lysozyme M1 (1,4-beta-N-acetylmuramidase)
MRAQGIDISKWQGTYRPATNPPRPVDFVIQRLSYGMKVDERLYDLKPGVMAAPVSGAYHYYSSAVGWREQCDLFLELMNDEYDFWAWDVEKGYNAESSSFIYGVLRAMEYLKKETGNPGLYYSSPNTWGTWMKPIQQDLLQYDLWIAHYWWVRANPASNPNYWTVKGAENMRKDWRFWQYDDKGGGNRGREFGVNSFGLDLDLFNGTVEELWQWALKEESGTPKLCPTCGQVLKG